MSVHQATTSERRTYKDRLRRTPGSCTELLQVVQAAIDGGHGLVEPCEVVPLKSEHVRVDDHELCVGR